MKKSLILFFACSLLTISSVSYASFAPEKHNQQQILIDCLSNHLSVKQYQNLSARKLSFSEKIDYFLLKHHLKKVEQNDEKGFSAGGFLLGLLLGPVGLGIAFLASKNKRFRKGAVTGFTVLIAAAIFGAIILVTVIGKF